MEFKIRELAEWLDIGDPRINDLKQQVIESLNNEKTERTILDRQCENREQTHCYLCDSEANCLILNGIIYLDLEETEAAIKEIEKANQHFRSEYETWNSIIGLIILGKAYEQRRKGHQALREYEAAHRLLTENYLRLHQDDYIDKAIALNERLANFIEEKRREELKQTASPSPSSNNDEDYLALFSLPVLGPVTARPDGIMQVPSLGDSFTVVYKVEIEDNVFSLHVIKKTSAVDHQITVQPHGDLYGWAPVRGKSMNAWDTPLNDGDYVLIYKSSVASHGDFVIASNQDPTGEMAPIVKRFDAENNLLLSKSHDKSRAYPPIPMDEEHQIIGVVIAVAKPA